MKTSTYELIDRQRVPKIIAELLHNAGIAINGPEPHDIQILDERLFSAVLGHGSLGLGEAYMSGWWDAERLDRFMFKLMQNDADEQTKAWNKMQWLMLALREKVINLQAPTRAFQVGEHHYDTGNDLFEAMLDPLMIYSCGYWEHAGNLEEAQLHKLDMICKKLLLKPGEKMLDIGCGWGGLAWFAATHYGVQVLGITVSAQQQMYARARCKGLPVAIELIDYRDLTGQFDKVVSVGMFEHVGLKNYSDYFEAVRRLMKTEGLFLLHTIGGFEKTEATDPWIDKYIFPNGKIPSPSEIMAHAEGKLVLEDWHNFGTDYDKTLMAWHVNFEKAWPTLKANYDERFRRMWTYYLMTCAAYFRARKGMLWQLVFGHRQQPDTYRSIRPFNSAVERKNK
ncbi:cyclopropane fatty acyl phospholipid synthase [Limnobacter sp.]|uniref:cyclopropane fatty acyl phospholipid synthase n=1 Tax=Limnobacter sp. TaxID=2003368 RepID=UPI002FE00A21